MVKELVALDVEYDELLELLLVLLRLCPCLRRLGLRERLLLAADLQKHSVRGRAV